jgi:hypothetical protein
MPFALDHPRPDRNVTTGDEVRLGERATAAATAQGHDHQK